MITNISLQRVRATFVGRAAIGLVLLVTIGNLARADVASDKQARSILDATSVKGGLIVHLGCADGRLTASLRANERYLVHGLERDTALIDKARNHIRQAGLYGSVTIDRLTGDRLPYIDNLVNLVIAEDLGGVPMDEVMRVLCPRGVAYIKSDGKWTKTVKPRPKELDDWTHYLHDASNNAVAHDTVIGPPRHMQWAGGPKYSRHHDHMSVASAMVTTGGRLFYFFDHASPMAIQLPPDWQLVARDAFNGTVLWRRAVPDWFTNMYRLKSGPVQITRRLVAVGDRVYATLGWEAPVTALDAATGKTVITYEKTARTEEIIHSDGVLFLLINDKPQRQSRNPRELNYSYAEGPRRIVAIDAQKGEILWSSPQKNVLPVTLTADGKRVLFNDGERIVALDRKTGQPLWQSEQLMRRKLIPSFFSPTLVVYDDVVLFSGGSVKTDTKNATGGDNTMYALSAKTGKTLWTGDHPASGYKSPEDILVINGVVWTTETTFGNMSGEMVGRDVHTGKVVKKFKPDVETHWFHHRCYRGKATDKYLLMSRTGIEFVDPKTEHWDINHWVRGACLYGVMPANGMVYNPPHPCACYLEAKLYGFNALAPASPTRAVPKKVPPARRLERGPAYGQIADSKSGSQDWPTYRHDAARSGSTQTTVSGKLGQAWQTELGGRLSSVVIAEGKVFVASIDTHTVHALDATTGEPAWSYTAGARVDSAPTIWRGRVLFGSADGYVYCLRASDGALAWRFRAAPIDQRMTWFNQVESVWPVPGSVLVHEGVIWCVAGRSMFVDGGLRLIRLDAATGQLVAETILDDRDPDSGKNLQVRLKTLNMPVALPDVLSADDSFVYMRSQKFDFNGVRQELDVPTEKESTKGQGAHLFCPTGFLDDVWWHRSYWVFGRVWKSGAGGYYRSGRVYPAGRPLVFNDAKVYGYGRKPQYYKWTTPMEYQLFAVDRKPEVTSLTGKKPAASPARKKQPQQKGKADTKKKKKRGAGRAPATRIKMDWTQDVPVLVRAMVLAKDKLVIAGPPDVVNEEESLKTFGSEATQKRLARQAAALEGAEGAMLWVVTTDGKVLTRKTLKSVPVFDGMAAANSNLYMSTTDGKVICLKGD